MPPKSSLKPIASVQYTNPLTALLQQLPNLPSVIRYRDDFDDEIRSIRDFDQATSCLLYINGSRTSIYFDQYEGDFGSLVKHLFVHFIAENLKISSIYVYLQSLYTISQKDINDIIIAGPLGIKSLWSSYFAKNEWARDTYGSLKGLLHLLTKNHLCGWSPSYSEFLSKTLPLPGLDKYASVRSGNVFLTTEEEARLVHYLDDFVALINQDQTTVDFDRLKFTGMLLCAYQFGMRPIQIASLSLRDVRVWKESGDDLSVSVHLTFRTVKQRTQSAGHPLLRKVKHQWAAIVVALYQRLGSISPEGSTRLFAVKSAREASQAIASLATGLVGRKISATDLRHTAAQRLVDAGASQDELAEFMGHTDITTGLVYFQTSPNQAERVNRALGISQVYQKVAQIAHDRFISKEELAGLKGEQQIAGVPHGIPIAGIGGCSSGQPACPFNPITSCYSCRKFMPLHELPIHQQVLQDLRGIVVFFSEASRGDANSPAYLQLQRTIANVQSIIAEIEGA
ncbi:MAG: site-specific integrase [Methylococcales bacterium]